MILFAPPPVPTIISSALLPGGSMPILCNALERNGPQRLELAWEAQYEQLILLAGVPAIWHLQQGRAALAALRVG